MKDISVKITTQGVKLDGDLTIPDKPKGIVIFAHGSGSSRHSPRNKRVAHVLQEVGLATLLMDLLTVEEEAVDAYTANLRFDIGLLAERLAGATDWVLASKHTTRADIGYFGASTGAAAALVAAAKKQGAVKAIVSRGGRPDLAGEWLPHVKAPTLLIVGGDDVPVIGLNEEAKAMMKVHCKLVIVPGATHLFEEPGKLDEVARLAKEWFIDYLGKP